jgi:hypothetical protein
VLFAFAGVPGVEYSGRHPRNPVVSPQQARSSWSQHGSRLSAVVLYTTPLADAVATIDSRHSFTMSISGIGISQFSQVAAKLATGPRRWAITDPSVTLPNVITVPAGTDAMIVWLSVTEFPVTAMTEVFAGIP